MTLPHVLLTERVVSAPVEPLELESVAVHLAPLLVKLQSQSIKFHLFTPEQQFAKTLIGKKLLKWEAGGKIGFTVISSSYSVSRGSTSVSSSSPSNQSLCSVRLDLNLQINTYIKELFFLMFCLESGLLNIIWGHWSDPVAILLWMSASRFARKAPRAVLEDSLKSLNYSFSISHICTYLTPFQYHIYLNS